MNVFQEPNILEERVTDVRVLEPRDPWAGPSHIDPVPDSVFLRAESEVT